MKIAYVSADPGIPVLGTKGAAIHLREMVNAFAALDHSVTVVAAMAGNGNETLNARLIEVYADAAQDTAGPIVGGMNGALAKERKSMAIAGAAESRLLELCSVNAIDLIYERYSLFSTAGVRVGRKLGLPCIVEVNAPLILEQQTCRELVSVAQEAAVEAEVFASATALLAVSDQVRHFALSRGAPPARATVQKNGVDLTGFHPAVAARSVAAAAGKITVGFVGSLKPWHGIETLFDAYRLLMQQGPDYHLLIVGDGQLKGWIEGFARGSGLEPHITLTGAVPYEEIPGWIKAMDIVTAPYPDTKDFYFSPLKLFEYMAAGATIIASRAGQIADVIADGIEGLLTPPGDVAALAEQIARLARDEALRRRLGNAAASAAQNCSWERNAQRVIDIATPFVKAA